MAKNHGVVKLKWKSRNKGDSEDIKGGHACEINEQTVCLKKKKKLKYIALHVHVVYLSDNEPKESSSNSHEKVSLCKQEGKKH